MDRIVRCQGAVLFEDRLLLLKHMNHKNGNVYWWLPGGGLEQGETPEQCVARELMEEANMQVRVERLLFESPGMEKYDYKKYMTFLCSTPDCKCSPGSEQTATRSILELRWFPLYDESNWDKGLYEDYIYPFITRIRENLDRDKASQK